MKLQKLIFTILITLFMSVANAADQAAKEDTTPPPQEGALTVDQIPPIASIPEGSPPVAPANNTNPPPSPST